MKNRIFRMRLDDDEEARLQREADERGLTKADRIRQALGWPLADRAPASRPLRPSPLQLASKPVDPDRQPGLSALQQIAKKLEKGKA